MNNIGDIRMIFLDVDGVLTDGSLIIGDDREIKIFNVHDGLGIELARQAGVKIYFVTSRDSSAVQRRAEELRIDGVFCGVANKADIVVKAVAAEGVDFSAVAFIGDDLVDLPSMQMVGCPIAVANAVEEVKAAACYITKKAGGHGGVREAIEWILKANGKWPAVLADYLQKRWVTGKK